LTPRKRPDRSDAANGQDSRLLRSSVQGKIGARSMCRPKKMI
jgi:hypothetical protein